MSWRSCIAAALALLASGAAAAQQAPRPDPAVTQHTLKLKGRTLAYTATAGLMPIRTADGAAMIGDMFYAAYTLPPRNNETRPVAFIWNGGSGANSTPLHYGAFGPKRLADGALKPNEATLLDVSDIVFLDQIETGFGRYASGANFHPHLNQRTDAYTFATFIETYLRDHGGPDRPLVLIGESYGVRRAQLVTEDLLARKIAPEALVLISGYSLVGKRLEPAADGAFRMTGYAALALHRDLLKYSSWKSQTEIHDATVSWAQLLVKKIDHGDVTARTDLAEGLSRFLGYSSQEIAQPGFPLDPRTTTAALGNLSRKHAPLLFSDIYNPNAYDLRHWDSDGREWISQAIIDDLRHGLGVNPGERIYVGQEYDGRSAAGLMLGSPQPMKVKRADGTIVYLTPETAHLFPELQGAMSALTGRPAPTPAPRPADGLAVSLVNFSVHFGASLSITDSPMPELMVAAPGMELFVIGGMYDDLVPCAVGAEMARRDLADFQNRVRSKCYVGGHMMYDEEAEGAILSDDVRAFIRATKADDGIAGAAVMP